MSTFTEIRDDLIKIGLPLLGAALPLPGGAALGSVLATAIGKPNATPSAILETLAGNSAAFEEAKKFEMAHQETLLRMQIDAAIAERKQDSADMAEVNTTMQEEIKASANEAWYQKAWRPANGFAVALGSLAAVCFTCWLFFEAIYTGKMEALQYIPSLAFNIGLILGVPGAAVGIASWHRGMQQREETTAKLAK